MTQDNPNNPQTPQTQTQTLSGAEQILEITQSLNMAQNINDILLKLSSKIAAVCQAERVTLFAFDSKATELYTKVRANNAVMEIRVPINESSMVGYAAKTGQLVNIRDAYNPENFKPYPGCKFDDKWDKQSGFRTKSVLSVPLRYMEKSQGVTKDTGLQGVIQLINSKKSDSFTANDEGILKKVAASLAVAFYNQRRIKKKPSKFSYLLEKDIISDDDLNKAIAKARTETDPIKSEVQGLLVNEFGVSKKDMGESLANFYETKFIEFDDSVMIPEDLLHGLNVNFLRDKFFVPIARDSGGTVTVLVDDPNDLHKVDSIRSFITARNHNFCVSLREDITNYLDLATGVKGKSSTMEDLIEDAEDDESKVQMSEQKDEVQDMLNDNAPTIVRLANMIIQKAYEQGVSDIHIEPYPGKQPTVVRYRLDGSCSKSADIPSNHVRALVNRIKIMAKLKVDEKRFPQSGKIKLKYGNKNVELRVEITPTVGGFEDVVMRILAAGKPLPLEKMNFSETNLKNLHEVIANPYGLILVVGPTGSGKTTTLHSVLGHLNKPDRKIWTAEDPVEITQYGLRQVQVNPNIKPIPFDFALAMRSFLRADPDIIMVGEMRDKETARMGIEASLTGHLVLSTLHTNSAPETITRLIDMGLNPINFADALLGILAQRLVKTLCPDCKEQYQPSETELKEILGVYGKEFVPELGIKSLSDVTMCRAKPKGCDACSGSGMRGRTGVFELLVGSKKIKSLIMNRATVEEIRKVAISEGMRTLRMDGIKKVLKGQTTMEQVRRVCVE